MVVFRLWGGGGLPLPAMLLSLLGVGGLAPFEDQDGGPRNAARRDALQVRRARHRPPEGKEAARTQKIMAPAPGPQTRPQRGSIAGRRDGHRKREVVVVERLSSRVVGRTSEAQKPANRAVNPEAWHSWEQRNEQADSTIRSSQTTAMRGRHI